MILTCPNCDTQYFADDSTIGDSGRSVKCAACDHSWFVGQKAEETGARPQKGGAHEAYREKVRTRRAKARKSAAIAAWVVVGGLFAGMLGTGVLLRNKVVAAWPQSASAFTALGLKVNRFGMEFADESAERYLEGTMPILAINGQVRNFTHDDRPAPLVRVRLLDDAGADIGSYYADVSPARIASGETGKFAARIENPPFEAFGLKLEFAPADTDRAGTGQADTGESATEQAVTEAGGVG